jgi:uncharacterized membrane protein YecN with MAPEG domain
MWISALYAALLAPLYVLLAVRVIALRRSARVAVGDGGQALLARRMRVQANFAEYVPYALLLMVLAESLEAPPAALHGLGVVLVVARLSHAWGMSQPREDFRFRVAGMIGTFAVLLCGAALCLWTIWARRGL